MLESSMNKSTALEETTFAPGDWVVHQQHGIGQIEGVEEKGIGGQTNTYCKIQTRNITIWLPVEKMNAEWLRPVSSPNEIEEALEVLKDPPQPMADNLNSRKNQIKKIDTNDSPVVIAELLRDLWALKKEKTTLSISEENTLKHFTDCFLAEWSESLNIPITQAKQDFDRMLRVGQEQITNNR